jgi:hypothetical protein
MRERLDFLRVSFAGILVEQINSKIISEPKHFQTMVSNLQPNGAVTCFFLLFSSPTFRTGQLYDAGESPASPGCPAFPVLPDMSPKKVSAMHNVFVSPLRARKADSLTSPHMHSLYACVGESAYAYQSPSKDLTAINNQLKKRRLGRLNFSEAALVSD